MALKRKTKQFNWNRKHLLGLRELSPEELTFILDTARGFEQISTRSVKKAPPLAGVAGLVTNIICYGGMYLLGRANIGGFADIQFLNRMAICFAINLIVMTIITLVKPLDKPVVFESKTTLDLKSSKGAFAAGMVVVIITVALYILFSPIGLLK